MRGCLALLLLAAPCYSSKVCTDEAAFPLDFSWWQYEVLSEYPRIYYYPQVSARPLPSDWHDPPPDSICVHSSSPTRNASL